MGERAWINMVREGNQIHMGSAPRTREPDANAAGSGSVFSLRNELWEFILGILPIVRGPQAADTGDGGEAPVVLLGGVGGEEGTRELGTLTFHFCWLLASRAKWDPF